MLVLAILAFTAVLGLGLLTLGETIAPNRDKIFAALRGQSLLASPVLVTRPVSVLIVSQRVSRTLPVAPQLRAAA